MSVHFGTTAESSEDLRALSNAGLDATPTDGLAPEGSKLHLSIAALAACSKQDNVQDLLRRMENLLHYRKRMTADESMPVRKLLELCAG